MKLWIDDIRPAPNTGWVIARTGREAKALIRQFDFTHISFDHDLGDDQPSGYDLVCLLEELVYLHGKRVPERLTCHSDNPPGKANIERAIKQIEKKKNE